MRFDKPNLAAMILVGDYCGMGIHMHVRLCDVSKPKRDDEIIAEWDTDDWDLDRDPLPSYEIDGVTWSTISSSNPVPGRWITDVQVQRSGHWSKP